MATANEGMLANQLLGYSNHLSTVLTDHTESDEFPTWASGGLSKYAIVTEDNHARDMHAHAVALTNVAIRNAASLNQGLFDAVRHFYEANRSQTGTTVVNVSDNEKCISSYDIKLEIAHTLRRSIYELDIDSQEAFRQAAENAILFLNKTSWWPNCFRIAYASDGEIGLHFVNGSKCAIIQFPGDDSCEYALRGEERFVPGREVCSPESKAMPVDLSRYLHNMM